MKCQKYAVLNNIHNLNCNTLQHNILLLPYATYSILYTAAAAATTITTTIPQILTVVGQFFYSTLGQVS